jgi:hypothetical protein
MKKNALFFVGINCCVLGSLTIYFSIEVKESLKKRSCFFYFFKTIQIMIGRLFVLFCFVFK